MTTGNPTMENYNSDTRFALMEQSIKHMDQKLDGSIHQINETLIRFEKRFDKIDERFDKIDQRFEKVDRDIKEVQKELKSDIKSNFFWTLGVIGVAFAAIAHGLKWF